MGVKSMVGKLDGLLRVGEAAEYLSVTSETLRNWDKSGRLVPTRHPVTGYRYYRREDLDAFLAAIIAKRGHE
ncbi:MerR family transcriptional regulator [Novipirellula sp. SH528]|uniref:MerR family transcriptional regulator n=1 Tax=Novipirellula sp. SH528 TaxID=3454466 RepID=UPI003F9F0E5D